MIDNLHKQDVENSNADGPPVRAAGDTVDATTHLQEGSPVNAQPQTIADASDWRSQAPEFRETAGRYVGAKEYARGGMGRILIAFDTLLTREVIIKELLPRNDGDAQTRAHDASAELSHPMMRRFMQEARVTGALEHPSIVPVYELGRREDGTPYYTMKMVRGKTLAQAINEASSLRERLRLLPHFFNLCQAIAYAHSRGVIHRDLKPANVMIGDFGETVVIDWGLARKLDDADAHETALRSGLSDSSDANDDPGVTAPGAVIGTPLYMAPEQALGDAAHIGKHTDVYALGVILYEIITGRVPHSFSSLEEAVTRVMHETPMPIETVEPQAPRTLAAICARAMHKKPDKRYASAIELAEDVERFLGGALVEAYEYRFSDHLRRFVAQHKRVLSVAVVMLVALLATGAISYVQITLQRNAADEARRTAERALVAEETARLYAEEQQQVAIQALEQEEMARIGAENARKAAMQSLYNAQISLAASHVGNGYYDRARQLLAACPSEFRNWEWGRLQFVCNQAYRVYRQQLHWNTSVVQDGYGMDARHGRALLEANDASARMINVFTGEESLRYTANTRTDFFVAVSPTGVWWLERERTDARLRETDSGRVRLECDLFNHWRWSFCFSADDAALAVRSAPEEVAVYCLKTETEQQRISEPGLILARLSHDGTCIATTAIAMDQPGRQSLIVRDVASGAIRLRVAESDVSALEFAPHGHALVVGTTEGELSLWLPGHDAPAWRRQFHNAPVKDIAFPAGFNGDNPDEAIVMALYDDGLLWIGFLVSGAERCRFTVPGKKAGATAITDDGAYVAISAAQRIYLHETEHGRLLRIIEGHEADIVHLAFSADGELLYSSTADDVRLWRVNAHGATQQLDVEGVSTIALLPESHTVRTATTSGCIQDWPLQAMEDPLVLYQGDAAVRQVLLSPRGDRVLGETDGSLVLRDVERNQTLAEFVRRVFVSTPTAFSPDGRWLALLEADALSQQADVMVYDAHTGVQVAVLTLYAREASWNYAAAAMAFSPDGETLAVTAWNRVTFFKIPEAYETESEDIPHQSDRRPNVCRFSADGKKLALTAGADKVLLLLLEEDANRHVLLDTSRAVTAMAFTRDGARIALGDAGGMATLRCALTGVELMNAALFEGDIRFLEFTDDDRALLAGDGNRCLLLRAFPWRDTELPGNERDTLEKRLEALITYSPHIAPVWGHCQQAMHRMEDRIHTGDTNALQETSCPDGGAYTLTENALPVCTLHGPLRNPAHLLERLARHESGDEEEERLWRALPDTCDPLRELAGRWLLHERNYPAAALLACEKGLALCPDNDALTTLKLIALLALNKDDDALEWSAAMTPSALHAHGAAPGLALVLARQGGKENLQKAVEILDDYLTHEPPNNAAQEAFALLRESPWWSENDMARSVANHLEHRPEERREMPWHASLDNALEAARASGKLVMINLSVPDSAAMRHLYDDVFTVPYIQKELLDYYEPVMLNAHEEPELLDRYGVTALPALVFLDAEGAVLRVEKSTLHRKTFVERYFHGFRDRGRLREWRIIGPFTREGCTELEAEARAAMPDFAREHPGKAGPVQWRAYRQPPVFHHTNLPAFYADTMNTTFYAYTCFEVAQPSIVFPNISLSETGVAWLNGEDISLLANRLYEDGEIRERLALSPGRHHLLLKISSRWNAHFRASLQNEQGEAVPGLTHCDMPEAPPLTLINKRIERAARHAAAEAQDEPNTYHLTINKQQIVRQWRENYVDILINLNPTPVYENGKPVGLRAEHPENIAILAASGFKNGDIVVSVNGYIFGGEHSILEIAERTEGVNPYIIKVKRGDEEHTFYVHVE